MNFLITGCDGQLGRELVKQLRTGNSVLGDIPEKFSGATLYLTDQASLDICDASSMKAYVQSVRPDVVIHCAAMTNVEQCEDMPKLAEQVNGEAVRTVAEACEAVNAKLIYISTDYVFSGEKDVPWKENDPCDPKTAYGKAKRSGELNALRYCSRTFVVRSAWLYGIHGHNFVKTILAKADATEQIAVVDDQFGNPTNAEDLAFHLLRLADTECYGIYHCTGRGVCSWFEFAKEIVALSGKACKVIPCSSELYPQKAKRPSYSALDHGALEATIGDRTRPWQKALKDYLIQLEEIQ